MIAADEWIEDIEIEDIPESLQPLAEAIGVRALLYLSREAGGTTLYVPKMDSIVQVARDRRIAKEFNGHNHKELAIRYNLSESWVRRIIR